MAENSAQERTEQATPKRLRDAREKGQVARSRELNTMMLMLASSGGLLVLGDSLAGGMIGQMKRGLSLKRADLFDTASVGSFLGTALQDALLLFAPFLALLFIVALLAPLSLGGWAFSSKALALNWGRLNVIKGFGRIFSRRGVVESLKAFAKFAVVATASGLLLFHWAGELFSLGDEPLHQGLAHMAHLIGWSFVAISAVLILITAVDVPFQLAEHARKLKMTRQEVKDEQKETDGNPEVKNRVRTLQRQLAQQRMMEDIPDADVVVTNPTHYAVALRYDQENMGAPRVVAKGADIIAGQIRKVAKAHEVTIVAAPPLTRALYFSTEIGQEIPAGLYLAVAQLLAYVFQLRDVHSNEMDAPEAPQDFPVPDEYLHPER